MCQLSFKRQDDGRIGREAISRCRFLIVLLLLWLPLPLTVGYAATSNYEATPATAIPDNQCPTYTDVVINVPDSFIITDLNVGLVVSHTWRNDLIVRLTSPAGTTLELFSRLGDGDNNLNILLDSDVTGTITNGEGNHVVTAPYYLNIFSPETATQLDNFNGEDASGNWTLGICDDVGADTGSIDRVLLSFDQSDFGDAPASYGDAQHTTPRLTELEAIVVSNVGTTATSVNTENSYTSPVVVCTYNLPSSADNEAVVRLDNVASNSFDVRIQSPDGSVVTASDVYCLVVEEGQHSLRDGRVFEARTVTSTGTNYKGSWGSGSMQNETASVTGTYANPVILGQVMTSNDADWSVFWSNDCDNKNNPPFDAGMADGICVGKHVGEDTDTTRANETLGYIIVEEGSGSYGGISYEAALGGDTVRGPDNAPPYSYALGQTYDFAVATQVAMDGADGAWAALYGASPLASSQIDLVVDEDTIGDSERGHATEQVSYWAFALADQPFIGTSRGDPEASSQSSATADGDDTNNADDEGGVIFRSPAGTGKSIYADVVVDNPTGGTVSVCAWLDVPSGGSVDGGFDASDGSCQTTSLASTTLTYQWSGMPTDQAYTTYARFRISSDSLSTSNATGSASDGEVEDYQVLFDFRPTSAVIDNFAVDMVTVAKLLEEGYASGGTEGTSAEGLDNGLISVLEGMDLNTEVAVVRWETLQERGTVGFYVERKQAGEGWLRLNSDDMLPGLITAALGGEYLLLDLEVKRGETHHYRLVEKEVWDSERTYGPWQVTVGAPAAPGKGANQQVAKGRQHDDKKHWGEWRKLKGRYVGRARQAPPPDEQMLARQQQDKARNQAKLKRSKWTDQAGLRLRTQAEGLYQVSLSTLVEQTGVSKNQLEGQLKSGRWQLSNNGEAVAYHYDKASEMVYFVGETRTTTDSIENVYQFKSRHGQKMQVAKGVERLSSLPGTFGDSLHFEQENWLLTYAHAEETADYGYWDYIYVWKPDNPWSKSSTDLYLDLPHPAADSIEPGQLRIVLRGANGPADGIDNHRAWVYLNDQPLHAEVEWDGNEQAILEVPFETWQLMLGEQSGDLLKAKVTIAGDAINTDAGYSLFFLERIDVGYEREMVAHNDQLWLHDVEAGTVTVTGFSTSDIKVVESPGQADTIWRTDVNISPDGAGGWQASFHAAGGDYLLSSQPLAASIEMDQPSDLNQRDNVADYLVIAPRALAQSAQSLATYREQRFSNVKLVWLQDIYDEFAHGQTDSIAIKNFLDYAYHNWAQAPRYVALLGRGTLDHPDRKGYGESLIPLRMAATPWGLAPSDNRYADIDGDHVPEYILGRIAASTEAQAQAYIDKVIAYEAAVAGDGVNNTVVVADNPDEAGDFHANGDRLADQISFYHYDVEQLYHPRDRVGSTLRSNWAAGGYGYVNYDGHGSPISLGNWSENFLSIYDVPGLNNGSQLPVFAALTCSAGDSSYPGQLSLGDTLTLHPDGGSIAGFVPTGLSLDMPAHEMNQYYIDALLGAKRSVGEAAHSTLDQAGSNGLDKFMLDIYTISGDPAVKMK